MSKSKQRSKKKKAKLKVLNVTQLAPDTHFLALEVKGKPDAGLWQQLKTFMGW